MATDPNKPLYSVRECKDRIVEIDDKIQKYEDIPEVAKDGPVSANFQTRIQRLQEERSKWERRLEEAKAYENSGTDTPTSTLQGPQFDLT